MLYLFHFPGLDIPPHPMGQSQMRVQSSSISYLVTCCSLLILRLLLLVNRTNESGKGDRHYRGKGWNRGIPFRARETESD